MRAPPESLMPMIGTRLRSASSCTFTIFSAVTSPSEPPYTVASYAYTATGRRSISPKPATTPSPAILRSSMPNPVARCVANRSSSTNELSSSSISMRSRALERPLVLRLFAASFSECSAWYRRLRYWLIFCSETEAGARSGAATPSTVGVVRRTGDMLFGLGAAIPHIVGAVPEYGPPLDLDHAMTLRQLRTFKAVVDLSSFSLAAQQLRLSQPSVSYQVKELEEAIGMALLDRLGKRVQLTQAGSILYAYARRTLDVLDEAALALDEMLWMKRGNLRVGASTTVGIYVLPAALGAFKKLHPGLVISLEIGTRARVQEQVLRNELDLAVVGPALKDSDLAILPFLTDELLVAAPARHSLAGKRRLSLKDLSDQPFVMREPASGSRWSLEKAARKAGARLNVAMELGSNGAIKHAVESGLGLAVLSRYACALELSSHRLVELAVQGFPIRRDWDIVHLRRRRLPASVQAFITFLKDPVWLVRDGRRGRSLPPTD